MIIGKRDSEVADVFSVFDGENQAVENIPLNEFRTELLGPSGADALPTHPVTLLEMGNGHYRVVFTPLSEGLYYLIVYHEIYFPAGKGGHFQIFSDDFSSLGAMIELVRDFSEGRWKIDEAAKQMIFFQADNVTEIARFNLFDSAGNPAVENIFDRQKV